ncbi:hypothetical protein [Mesorhizobium sp. M0185]|uniref:hypothetical protein n=1 Tax=unclassified Mesorhizobium TaxID=325217 RepID=UPI003337A8D4
MLTDTPQRAAISSSRMRRLGLPRLPWIFIRSVTSGKVIRLMQKIFRLRKKNGCETIPMKREKREE